MVSYDEFLRRKAFTPIVSGIESVPELHKAMTGEHRYQADVCAWALRLGRAACFLGTGLGKTLIEMEWARVVSEHTKAPVLILAPLAVAEQISEDEAPKFGYSARYYTDGENGFDTPLVISNYDRLDRFNPDDFGGVVLDESSILKAMDGKTRAALIDAFNSTPYKLCGTATPAPNDYMELGNHAEFLGVMTAMEMLSMFFVHDGGETQKWRLKGHAKQDFWKWVCSWAVSMRKPSDIGYSDEGFDLPPLIYHHHVVDVEEPSEGMLFAMPAETLQERIGARRSSINERVTKVAEIVSESPDESWLAWCNLNSESVAVAETIGCMELTGSEDRDVKKRKMLDFAHGKIQKLVSKSSIMGFGLNLQVCSHMVFVGVNDSWEQFYQAVRRCWRFGQTKPVHVHIVSASTESNVIENLARKDKEAQEMAEEMAANTQDLTRMNLKGTTRTASTYTRELAEGKNWKMHLADCVELAQELPSDSVHFSVYSPPFESLYTYSNSDRDMGNSRDSEQFWEHYRFLIRETFRVMMPGRLVSIHCMNLPTSKVRDGVIGIRDFRGEIIRAFEDVGFIYHSEVCIWKDPVTAMQRTKALGLLHKQLKKDSCMSRQGIPDYLVTMRKPGDNPERVTNTNESFPVQLWQEYASPIWTDINPSDTLQHRSAREHDDERHICPLQLEVIRRAIKLWSNEGDTVWSPFAGIGSEGVVAIEMGRKFLGSELKRSYWTQAVKNLTTAHHDQHTLFDSADDVDIPIRIINGEPVRISAGSVMGAEIIDPYANGEERMKRDEATA